MSHPIQILPKNLLPINLKHHKEGYPYVHHAVWDKDEWPHDDKPTLITYLPNALCKDSITKMH